MNAYEYRKRALRDPLDFVYYSGGEQDTAQSLATLFQKVIHLYFRGTDAEKIQFFNDEFKRLSGEIDAWAETQAEEDDELEKNRLHDKYERENPVRPLIKD